MRRQGSSGVLSASVRFEEGRRAPVDEPKRPHVQLSDCDTVANLPTAIVVALELHRRRE